MVALALTAVLRGGLRCRFARGHLWLDGLGREVELGLVPVKLTCRLVVGKCRFLLVLEPPQVLYLALVIVSIDANRSSPPLVTVDPADPCKPIPKLGYSVARLTGPEVSRAKAVMKAGYCRCVWLRRGDLGSMSTRTHHDTGRWPEVAACSRPFEAEGAGVGS
jgi:hypothetical protein